MFPLRCFSVFIVNFEQVNVCPDNCCIVKFFKTHLKSLAKMNILFRVKVGFYQGLKYRLPTGVIIENF